MYAPAPGWTPPTGIDPNYGDKAFFDTAPGTGDLSDAYAAATGRTLFTGEEVRGGARLLAVGAAVLPLFTSGGFRQGRRFIEGLDNIVPGSSTAVRRITGPLTDPLKNSLRREARDVFFSANPRLSSALQIHHRVPLEWAHLFPGADPNRLANIIGLDRGIHNQVSAMWTAFRNQHPYATPQDVMTFAAQIDQRFSQYYNQVLPRRP